MALGLAQTLAWGSTYYLPAILAAPMADDLGVDTSTIFGVFSLALIITAIIGPIAGSSIDRHGGRMVLVISNIVFAAGLLTLAVADSVILLGVGWLVIGVGMALGLYEAAFSTLAGILGQNARPAISGITLLAGFASTVCWPVTAWLEAEFGWRSACAAWAAMHLVVGLPLNARLPHGRKGRSDPGAPPAAPAPLRVTALLAFVFAVTWFTSTAMAAHLPWILQESGLSPAMAIAAAALVGPAQVAARFLEVILLRRFHPLISARLATVCHPLGAVGLIWAGASAATPFTLMHGAGNGILTIAKGTLPLAMFGPQGYGRMQGILMAPARLAQALSPFLFAVLITHFGTAALTFTALLGVLACFALFVLQPSFRTQPSPVG
ncbi:MFS transporter [Gilvimarinus sp. F26214L]|uniref:MFS transporter n=1 Tax=Gilvimarinus sp. DZF01 TaxID=3461371 RepID=UPI00404595AA